MADAFEQFPGQIQKFMDDFFRHPPHAAVVSSHGTQAPERSDITPGQQILTQDGLNSEAQQRANAVLVMDTRPVRPWDSGSGNQERGVAAIIITALGVIGVATVLFIGSCGKEQAGPVTGGNAPAQAGGDQQCGGNPATADNIANRRELQKTQDTRVIVCDPVTGKQIGVCVAFGYRQYNPKIFQPATLREAASYVSGYTDDAVRENCLGENNNVVAWMNKRLKVSEPIIKDLPVAIPVTISLERENP